MAAPFHYAATFEPRIQVCFAPAKVSTGQRYGRWEAASLTPAPKGGRVYVKQAKNVGSPQKYIINSSHNQSPLMWFQ
jgi:hypothetical protein